MATEPTDNLLAAAYHLTREAPYASAKDIASFGVTHPTVSEQIVRLAKQGYLDHRWRQGVALTQRGRLIALKVLRKHRLIETFLVKVLNYSIDAVNKEPSHILDPEHGSGYSLDFTWFFQLKIFCV